MQSCYHNTSRTFSRTWNFSKQTVIGLVPLTFDPSALLAFNIGTSRMMPIFLIGQSYS